MGLTRAIAWGVGLATVALALMVAPAAAPVFLPRTVLEHPVEWSLAIVGLAWIAAEWAAVRRRERDVVDRVSIWALRQGLFPILAAWTLVRLAAFLPHYPYWPWARDPDSFAVTARQWDLGVLPYRDVRSYNFPGHVYLHWLLGRAFGWGRPGLFYVVDALTLLALGGVLLAWSRRRLGGPTPGLLAYFAILAAYFDIPIEIVAQRDWHATLGAAVALMTLQAWPERAARWASAATAAAAFLVRPHLVLFLPALALAAWRADDDADGEHGAESWKRRAARVAECAGAFAAFVAIGLAPLIVSGILDDLVRNLRTASYGGPYSTFSPERAWKIVAGELGEPMTTGAVVALALLSVRGPLRWTARAWLAAMAGAIVYRPLHPVDHGYLQMPLKLVTAIAWAPPAAWVMRIALTESVPVRRAFPGLLAIGMLIYDLVPMREPWNCSLSASLDAVRASIRGGWPATPPGAYLDYDPHAHPPYPWDDYNRLLRYIREETGPETVVANLIKRMPLSPMNGPTGRPSPFRAESGICWMWLVRMDLDEEFARQLEAAGPGSIVVWEPDETDADPRLRLPLLSEAVRRDYAPEARFGRLEVWRRKPAAAEAVSGTP